jgi:hypothetical protein
MPRVPFSSVFVDGVMSGTDKQHRTGYWQQGRLGDPAHQSAQLGYSRAVPKSLVCSFSPLVCVPFLPWYRAYARTLKFSYRQSGSPVENRLLGLFGDSLESSLSRRLGWLARRLGMGRSRTWASSRSRCRHSIGRLTVTAIRLTPTVTAPQLMVGTDTPIVPLSAATSTPIDLFLL